MADEVEVKVELDQDFSAVSRRLKEGDKAIRKGMNKGVRRAAKPMVDAAKASIMEYHPGGHARSRGTRAAIAKAIQVKITTSGYSAGIRIRVNTAQLGDRKALPKLINKGNFRHPVFGSDNWADQKGKPNWFHGSMIKHKEEAFNAIRQEIQAAIDQL